MRMQDVEVKTGWLSLITRLSAAAILFLGISGLVIKASQVTVRQANPPQVISFCSRLQSLL